MIELNITVEDFDTHKTVYMKLPCVVKDMVNVGHDLQITDWDLKMPIDFCSDIESLNKTIEDINCDNPNITLEILEVIARTTGCRLSDSSFIEKLCSNDFMFEEVDMSGYDIDLISDIERCAHYMVTELEIPFAKNLGKKMDEMKVRPKAFYDWRVVWRLYTKMGFQLLHIGKNSYIFNWRNAAI